MNIAVVGAGYGGLSVSWHLLQLGANVVLFDAVGIGAGASGASTGLLHPYPAKSARRSARADVAMEAARELIAVAENVLGKPAASHSGIVRFAMDDEQAKTFQEPLPDAVYLGEKEIRRRFPDVVAEAALWIEQGKTVFAGSYLQGLWMACEKGGARFEKQRVESLDELRGFDAIILASGADLAKLDLPVAPKRGQALLCRWPKGIEKPPCSLIGHGHLSLTEEEEFCLLGSTYEIEFDPQRALALREQIGVFYPPARDFEIVDVKRGVRMSPKQGYLPLIQEIAPGRWVFTGLGSRGLLYHGLYGKELAQLIVSKEK